MYCLECRKVTDSVDTVHKISKSNRNLFTANCVVCDSNKNQFVKAGREVEGSMTGGDLVGYSIN